MEDSGSFQTTGSGQSLKGVWIIIAAVIITTLIIGSISSWWFNFSQNQSQLIIKNLQNELSLVRENNKQLRQQVVNLQNQLDKSSGESGEDIGLLVEELCKNKKSLGLNGYDDGEIYKCGHYIKVYPPNYLMDAPVFIFDRSGNKITYCGGMPQPTPRETPEECKIQCEGTQLKLCSGSDR